MPEERKLVTVLFADFAGSTASARGRDAEVVRRTLAETFTAMRAVLESHGGTVEKFIGDAVFAVFGVPAAHEDDADRAVRAAFAVREAVTELSSRAPLKFGVRIGVNTGEAVAGTEASQQFLVTGPVVVAGARLEQRAKAGEILVGALTRELTTASIRYGRPRRVAAKGLGFLLAAPALEVTAAVPEQRRGVRHLRAPLIGRDRELAELLEFHSRVQRDGQALVVTVVAPAGAGKSRLAREFIDRIGEAGVHRGRCLPYGDAITFYPIQQMLRTDAGIEPSDDLAAARVKLHEAVRGAIPESDVEAVAHRLAVIAGLASAHELLADVPTAELPDELRWAVRRYFERRAADGPSVLVFEDVHWGEPTLLELIEHLGTARTSLFVLCLARQELIERQPTWGTRPGTLVTRLSPLAEADMRQLIASLLAIEALPDGLRTEVVNRAGGNPLFVEEFLRLLIEGGYITRRGSRWLAARDAPELSVPPTLHGLIEARLDHLPSALKRLAQHAAVAGRVVSEEALAILDGDLASHLPDAVEHDLLSATDEVAFGEGPSYRFSHVLVRDVAYAMLAKADRLALHDRFAHWLAERLGGRRDEAMDIVAYHAERAYLLSRELAAPRIDIGRRALQWLMGAAALARAREDMPAAMRIYERATAIVDEIDTPPQDRVAARGWHLLMRATVRPGPEVATELESIIEDGRDLGPSEIMVRLLLERAERSAPDATDQLADYLVRASEMARVLDDAELIGETLFAAFMLPNRTGRVAEAERLVRVAYDYARDRQLPRLRAGCLGILANHGTERGALTEVRGYLAQGAQLDAETGSRLARAQHLRQEQWLCEVIGDFDLADRVCAEHVSIARDIGTPGTIVMALWFEGDLRTKEGRYAEAESRLEEALALATTYGLRIQPRLLNSIAIARTRVGKLDEALRDVTQGLEQEPAGMVRGQLTITLAEIQAARGYAAAADASFRAGIALVDKTGFGWVKTTCREEYAAFLIEQRRWGDARRMLEEVLPYYHDALVAHRRSEIEDLIRQCSVTTGS